MSRSAERGAVAAVVLGLVAASAAVPARADSPSPSTTPQVISEPLPTGTPAELPVVDIAGQVLTIGSRTEDLSGTATVDEDDRKIDVTLNSNVLFGKDSATILPAANARLVEIAAILKARSGGRLTITGYTDDLGSAAHGLTLSRQRAAAVAARFRPLLPAAGFTFVVSGHGEADPVAKNDSEAHRRMNRRVELGFTPR